MSSVRARSDMNVRRRVLILHSRYLSGSVSGENRVVADEALLLRNGGHSVRVIEASPRATRGLGLAMSAADAVWSRAAVARVRRAVDEFAPDVVHCHNLFPSLSPAVLRAAASRTAVVMTLHNYRLGCLPGILFRDGRVCEDCVGRVPWPGIVHRCYRGSAGGSAAIAASLEAHRRLGTLERVGVFVAVSEFVRDKHRAMGISPHRVVVKPHFAWPTERRSGPGARFLIVSRLSPEKGILPVVRSWDASVGPLVVVGSGPQIGELRLHSAAGVRFTGPLPPEKVAVMVREARAVLVPSATFEAAGRSVVEAYAAGVPVIANRIGGLPEVVDDGVTGVLVEPDDDGAWREAARRLRDDAEAVRLGEGAYARWGARHSPDVGLEHLEAVYARAVGDRMGYRGGRDTSAPTSQV